MQKFSKPFFEGLRSLSKKLAPPNSSPLPAARRGNPPSVTTNNSGGCTQAPMKRTRRGCRNFRKASTSFFMASQKPTQIRSMFRLNPIEYWKKEPGWHFQNEIPSWNVIIIIKHQVFSKCEKHVGLLEVLFSPFFVWKFSKSDLFASSPRDEPRHWCVSQPPISTHIWGMVWQWVKWPGWNSWTAMRHMKLRIQIHWMNVSTKLALHHVLCYSHWLLGCMEMGDGLNIKTLQDKTKDTRKPEKPHLDVL